jgi:hypothetical protein
MLRRTATSALRGLPRPPSAARNLPPAARRQPRAVSQPVSARSAAAPVEDASPAAAPAHVPSSLEAPTTRPAGGAGGHEGAAAAGLPRAALVAVHASSSALFMAGAAAVELLTTVPALNAGHGAALYYPSTGAEAWGWAALVMASGASGWALASRERPGAERANFQDYAVQAALGQLFTLWLSPYWPRGGAGGGCYAFDAAMGAAIVALSCAQLATQGDASHRTAIAHGRRDKAAAASAAAAPAAAAGATDLPGWAASAAYFQPAAVGPVMMIAAGAIQACVPAAWLSTFQGAHPEHAAIAFHFGLITTLAGHAGMFAPTLRDRRRISQRTEAAVCAVSSYAALGLLAAFMLRYPWLWQVAGPWATLFPVQ